MSSAFSVITNLPSLVAQHNATQNQQGLQRTLFRLSTGQRLFRGGRGSCWTRLGRRPERSN